MNLPIVSMSVNTRKLTSFALVAFMAGGLLGSLFWNFGGVYVPKLDVSQGFGFMKQFESDVELRNFVKDNSGGYRRHFLFGIELTGRGFSEDAVESAQTLSGSDGEVDYSSTNIQVEGVDEADLVKTDGKYIYLVKGSKVYIIRCYPPEEAEVISSVDQGVSADSIYIAGNKLVVFSYLPSSYQDVVRPEIIGGKDKTQVMIYDISDRANPSVDRELVMDGYYFNSRLIGEHVYFIIKNPAYLNDDEPVLPTIREGREWTSIEPTEVWYSNITRGWLDYTTITSLNIHDSEAPIKTETFLLDSSTNLYVSQSNLYMVGNDWGQNSTITKIEIQDGDITFRANASVPGYVLNQFSMDEFDGYFRIATTLDTWVSENAGSNVYVLDESLELVGSLEGLAPGEQIYSARFMGERCYLVTFKKVDPLFTIDLSNPGEPEVLGKLKIPGFSNYLHPYDENILIGVGKETTESEYGDFAWHQGVKISLFDVSDVKNPRELAKFEIGDRGSNSPALHDHHAFLFSRDRNLLVIPVLEAQIDESDFSGEVPPDFYGDYVYQGAYVFNISEAGIDLRGKVTHIEDDNLMKSGYWFSSEFEVKRSLYIEDNLYTISSGMIKINSLDNLEEVATVRIGE
jgi:uncharacterized secreted protein with C-terminal beta-propeller domain